MSILEEVREAQTRVQLRADRTRGQQAEDKRELAEKIEAAQSALKYADVFLHLDLDAATVQDIDGEWIPHQMGPVWMGPVREADVDESGRFYLEMDVPFQGIYRPVRIYADRINDGFAYPPDAVERLFESLMGTVEMEPNLQESIMRLLELKRL